MSSASLREVTTRSGTTIGRCFSRDPGIDNVGVDVECNRVNRVDLARSVPVGKNLDSRPAWGTRRVSEQPFVKDRPSSEGLGKCSVRRCPCGLAKQFWKRSSEKFLPYRQ